MRKKRSTLVLICALSLPLPVQAEVFDDMFGIMFRMMLTMMNVMGDSMNGSNSSGWPGNSMWSGMGGWPAMTGLSGMGGWPAMTGLSGMGGWPMNSMMGSPWSFANPGASPWTGGYTPGMGGLPVNQPWAGGPGGWNRFPGTHHRVSLLEGKWYGVSGEILEVRGKRFQLRDGVTSLSGALEVDNNLVKMFTPQTGAVNIYQFARNESELVLQDSAGGTLVFYRRPWAAALPVRVF